IKRGASEADDLVVAKVRYEAVDPWPVGASTRGAALQLIDPSQDNARVSNWSDGNGWRFASITKSTGGTVNTNNPPFSVATNLNIFVQLGAGDAYLDDVSLVPLSGHLAGINVLSNSDF